MNKDNRWFIEITRNVARGNEIIAELYSNVFFLIGTNDRSCNVKMKGKNLWEVPTDKSASLADIMKMIEEAGKKYGFKIVTYRKRGGGKLEDWSFPFSESPKTRKSVRYKKIKGQLNRRRIKKKT